MTLRSFRAPPGQELETNQQCIATSKENNCIRDVGRDFRSRECALTRTGSRHEGEGGKKKWRQRFSSAFVSAPAAAGPHTPSYRENSQNRATAASISHCVTFWTEVFQKHYSRAHCFNCDDEQCTIFEEFPAPSSHCPHFNKVYINLMNSLLSGDSGSQSLIFAHSSGYHSSFFYPFWCNVLDHEEVLNARGHPSISSRFSYFMQKFLFQTTSSSLRNERG